MLNEYKCEKCGHINRTAIRPRFCEKCRAARRFMHKIEPSRQGG